MDRNVLLQIGGALVIVPSFVGFFIMLFPGIKDMFDKKVMMGTIVVLIIIALMGLGLVMTAYFMGKKFEKLDTQLPFKCSVLNFTCITAAMSYYKHTNVKTLIFEWIHNNSKIRWAIGVDDPINENSTNQFLSQNYLPGEKVYLNGKLFIE